MAEASNVWAVLALCAASAATGAYAMHERQQAQVIEAQSKALTLQDLNDQLVRDKAKAIGERDEWQRRARTQRQAIYAIDSSAQAWGNAPVPDSLSARVRDAAIGTDSAATNAGSEH